ncbi:metallophosphoesterase 1 homolog [Leptidea sinapis]|uniref:metallophosphoesterase 1 homolog n=1 Tax=Leptidea sinapis TaxID=189913 RepID=UPI0021C40F58|nr:metallophosphoesterase 1 homolog [Leptidea sinapis]
MRRISKKLILIILGLFCVALYCEWLIYYVVIAQCSWLRLEKVDNQNVLKAFILADPHLLGPFRGHWLDKWRREWQMHQAFQAILNVHKPNVVFVLGDLFDEGEWTDNKQFNNYVERFYRLFTVPKDIKMHVVVGNHDIGFHNRMRRGAHARFNKLMNSSSVQHLTLKNNHFVLINSMAFEGDSCNMCTEARKHISSISDNLNKCEFDSQYCHTNGVYYNYSKPILMQHFPLYRLSDSVCTEPDAPPLPERNKRFRLKIDALSREATDYLVSKIRPRAAFGGHTHHGCLVRHSIKTVEFLEYSVPSFSWRNRPDPKFMLVSISPDDYAVSKCGLPKESTICLTALILSFTVIVCVWRMKTIGR